MLPRITVVTPSLNHGRYIADAIESVARQQYPNLEYFIRDGGSTDGTEGVVRRHASLVSDYVSEPDAGQPDAINKGFEKASGELLCWLNADDLFEPGALRTIGELYRSSRFDFAYGDGWKLSEGGRRRAIRAGVVTPEHLAIRDPILQPATFWTRDVWRATGNLDDRLHYVFDWDFFVRVSRRFPMSYVRSKLATYRIHPGHKSGSGGKTRAAEIMEVIRRYAPSEWRSVFEDLWAHYDSFAAPRKFTRLAKAGLHAACDPRLLARHGPGRYGLAALTLL